jgi:hypothetical protein
MAPPTQPNHPARRSRQPHPSHQRHRPHLTRSHDPHRPTKNSRHKTDPSILSGIMLSDRHRSIHRSIIPNPQFKISETVAFIVTYCTKSKVHQLIYSALIQRSLLFPQSGMMVPPAVIQESAPCPTSLFHPNKCTSCSCSPSVSIASPTG